jgi:hypothetical protein
MCSLSEASWPGSQMEPDYTVDDQSSTTMMQREIDSLNQKIQALKEWMEIFKKQKSKAIAWQEYAESLNNEA